MSQLKQISKYSFLFAFLLMTMIAAAQKANTVTNVLMGNPPNQAVSVGDVYGGVTADPTQSEKGSETPNNTLQNTGGVANDATNQGQIGGAITSSCPLMYVEVSIPFLQSCVSSTARISYCNHGNSLAANVYIDIQLDSVLILDSASVSYTALGNGNYRFQVGTVDSSFCDGLDLFVTTHCDPLLLNQEHCINAHIYPDSICQSVWNGYLLQSDAQCMGNAIDFRVQNNGATITQAAQVYYVIIDDHLLINGSKLIVKQGALTMAAATSKTISLTNITAGKDYTLKVLDSNDVVLTSTTMSHCSLSNNGMVYQHNQPILWNGSTVPFRAKGCNINGNAPVVARGTQTNPNNKKVENTALQIMAFPNPFQTKTTIKITEEIAANYTFELYDLTGRLVRHKRLESQTTFDIQRGNLQTGIYLYRVISLNGKMLGSGKLIIK